MYHCSPGVQGYDLTYVYPLRYILRLVTGHGVCPHQRRINFEDLDEFSEVRGWVKFFPECVAKGSRFFYFGTLGVLGLRSVCSSG